MRAGSAWLGLAAALLAAPAHAQAPACVRACAELDFARSLLDQQDWYRAIGQLKRYRHFEGPEAVDGADALIGLAYLRGRQNFDAWKLLADVAGRASAPAALRSRAALLGPCKRG